MAVALMIALLLSVGSPSVGTDSLELSWDAGSECPGSAQVEAVVSSFLSAPLEAVEPTRATGHVATRGPMFVLVLDIRAPGISEHHELSAVSCDELVEAAGLLIAGVVEPVVFTPDMQRQPFARVPVPIQRASKARAQRPPLAKPAPAVSEPAESSTFAHDWELVVMSDAELRDLERRQLVSRWSALLHTTGAAMANLLPHPGGGARLGARAERGALRLGGGLDGWFGPGFRDADDPSLGGQLWAGTASLLVCGVPERRAVRFPLCAEAGAGFFRGRGVGVEVSKTATLPWVWVAADAGIEWWIRDRVAITMGVAVLGSLARPSFVLDGTGVSYQTPPVAARAQLGVVTRIRSKPRASARSKQARLFSAAR